MSQDLEVMGSIPVVAIFMSGACLYNLFGEFALQKSKTIFGKNGRGHSTEVAFALLIQQPQV